MISALTKSELKCPFDCDGTLKKTGSDGYVAGLCYDEEEDEYQEDPFDVHEFTCNKCSQLIFLDSRDSTYFLKECTCGEQDPHSKYCASVSEHNPWNKK